MGIFLYQGHILTCMVKGPLGGPRIFAKDNKVVVVVCGTEGGFVRDRSVQNSIDAEMAWKLTSSGEVSTNFREATERDRGILGGDTLGIIKTTVGTSKSSIDQREIDSIERQVKQVLSESMGFNLTGTKVVVE